MATPRRRVLEQPQTPRLVAPPELGPAAVGAPSAATTEQALGSVNDQIRFAQTQINEANNLAIQTLKNRADRRQFEIETAALEQRGRNAFDITETSTNEYNDFMSELDQEALSPTQQAAMAELRRNGDAQIRRTTEKHTLGEINRVKGQEFAASSVNILESSLLHWDDEDRLGDNLFEFSQLTIAEGERLGLGPEATEAFFRDRMSAYHKSIFDKHINEKDRVGAQGYMNFAKDMDQLSQSAILQMEITLKEAQFRGDAQQATDKIMRDESSWRKRFQDARQIENSEQRDEVARRLRQRMGDEDRLRRDEGEGIQIETLNIIDDAIENSGGRGVSVRDALGPEAYSELTLRERIDYENYASANAPTKSPEIQRLRTIKRDSSLGALWDLWRKDKQAFMNATTMNRDDATGRWFPGKLNLEMLKPLIGETDYNRFKRFQEQFQTNKVKEQKDILDEMMEDAIEVFNIRFTKEILEDESEGIIFGGLDLDDPQDEAQIKILQRNAEKLLRKFIDDRFQSLPPEQQDEQAMEKIITAAWLNVDVDRAGNIFEDVDEPFGFADLPLFIAEELFKEKNVLGATQILKTSSLSNDARRYFRDNLGIPSAARFDFDTEEFFLTGNALQSYLKFQNLPSTTDEGRDIKGAWVGLDGVTKRVTSIADRFE